MKKRFLALLMVLVTVLSIVGTKEYTSYAAKKTYSIDVQGDLGSSVDISFKKRKMTIKGDIMDMSKKNPSYKESTKKLTVAAKCKCYVTEEDDTKISYKEAKETLTSGEFVAVEMKIKNNKVYVIRFHC